MQQAAPTPEAGRSLVARGPLQVPLRRPTQSGFTLLEVAISLSVLATVLGSTILTLVPMTQQNLLSQEIDVALVRTRGLLEEIKAVPRASLPERFPSGSSLPFAALVAGRFDLSYDDLKRFPLLVRVDVSWQSADGTLRDDTFYAVKIE